MSYEKKTKVEAIMVRKFCDLCNIELTFTGGHFLTNPPKYVYRCEKCKAIEIFTTKYPTIKYEELDETNK